MSDGDVYKLELKHSTEFAILVADGDKEIWLPKSQIKIEGFDLHDLQEGDYYDISIPDWLAEKKELI